MAAEPLTIDRLERWVLFGAQWRVVDLSLGRAVVDFCTCAGMLVERLQTDDPAVIDYLRAALSEPDVTYGPEGALQPAGESALRAERSAN